MRPYKTASRPAYRNAIGIMPSVSEVQAQRRASLAEMRAQVATLRALRDRLQKEYDIQEVPGRYPPSPLHPIDEKIKEILTAIAKTEAAIVLKEPH